MLKKLIKRIWNFVLRLFGQLEPLVRRFAKQEKSPNKTEAPIEIKKKIKYAKDPRSDEAFEPFRRMSLEEWKQHPCHRLGSSYLIRLINSRQNA